MNNIEKQVLRIIGENVDSPDVFDDANITPIRDSINDAIEEIITVNGGYTETFTIPLVTEKSMYRLSFRRGTFGWVQDAWLVNNKRRLTQTSIFKLSNQDPRWLESSGTPEQYFLIGHDVIGFYRKPSASSDVVDITSIVIPTPYENEDEKIKLRKSYERTIINYAVSEYYAGRGDAIQATNNFGIYLNGVSLDDQYSLFQERQITQRTDKQRDL